MEVKFRLVARRNADGQTAVQIGPVTIGRGSLVIMAGPCAVEDYDRTLATALALKEYGVHVFRGGAFKPRTSPYSFQGLGKEGLEILAAVRDATGLPVVTEVLDTRDVELVCRYADVIQIGSRNMHNYALLREAGRAQKPVLLKRGLAATLEEWLLAAEYVLAEGNDRVVLCERGIRTFETHTRNTLDVSAIAAAKSLSHLPVIADPSHAAGRRDLVAPLALAAVAAGADGVMVEVHPCPGEALCDGEQSLDPAAFARLVPLLRQVAAARNGLAAAM
jgi:3-deoxy-7-phosphoheptulonate synthase